MQIRKSLTLLMALALTPFLGGCPKVWRSKPSLEELSQHRLKQIANWNRELSLPVEDRIFAASADVVDYLDLDNRYNGYESEPKEAKLTPELTRDIRGAIEALPAGLRKQLAEKLIGVFVVKGLGSSAYTDYVRDEKKRPRFAYVVIDVDAMNRKANDWMTWKENSPFLADASLKIEGKIEDEAQNTIGKALEYVLIHEFGHVLAFNSDIHPLWSVSSKKIDVEDYPFLEQSWIPDPNSVFYVRKIDNSSPAPGPIIYYKPSFDRPSAATIPAFYDWLAKTDFVTLYAATNPYDDFAEALVTYVHTVVQKRPWEIRLIKNGQVERTLKPCWDEPRCAEKRKLLEEFMR